MKYVVPSQLIPQALRAAGVWCSGPIKNWDAWRAAIKAQAPDLLIILAHADFDSVRGEYSMLIGAGDDLPASLVREREVDVPPGTPGPVVLLFGCLTATVAGSQATFASKFLRNASVVIGTTSEVLGRQSGPVAAELIAAIKKSDGRVPLGEMLMQARIEGLKNNSVMAMALNAFGDADHLLAIQGSS